MRPLRAESELSPEVEIPSTLIRVFSSPLRESEATSLPMTRLWLNQARRTLGTLARLSGRSWEPSYYD